MRNTLNFLVLFLSFCSCTGLPVKKTFAVREFGTNDAVVDIPYWSSHYGEQHCFKDQDKREIITTEWMDFKLALDHFFKRTASVYIKSDFDKPGLGTEAGYIRMTYVEGANYQIEVADCTYYHLKHFFGLGVEIHYRSFRIRNDSRQRSFSAKGNK